MRQIIMPSDVILHRPTGETWTVCGVDHKAGRLIPCGYPFPTVARIEDCEVIERHYETQYQTEEQIKALQKYELTSFFGDFDGHIFGPWEPIPGSKFYRTPFLGFDEKKGAICALPRSGTKTRAYPDTTACPHFKPRTWTRPPSCHDCDRKHGEMSDGSVLCSGWPFYKKEGDVPCQNGKMAYGKNLSLF